MGPLRPESNTAPAPDGDPRSAPDAIHRYATVDPEELLSWSRRLREFCSDKFTPQNGRS